MFLALDASLDELCEAEPTLARYGKVRLSTAGRLRAAGFALLPTLARPHYDIVLPDLAQATLARLEGSFDAPIPGRDGVGSLWSCAGICGLTTTGPTVLG